MRNLFGAFLVVAVGFAFPAARTAEAINITPSTIPQWTGDDNSNTGALTEASGLCGCDISNSSELYKQDVGGPETGPYAGSYTTVFTNTPSDPSGATITYVGGPSISGQSYLLVKDGQQDPAWYLFDLLALGWTGTQQIVLSGFWPAQGAISHVAIYGGSTSVPEPATLSLLGLGLAGLGLARRRKLTPTA